MTLLKCFKRGEENACKPVIKHIVTNPLPCISKMFIKYSQNITSLWRKPKPNRNGKGKKKFCGPVRGRGGHRKGGEREKVAWDEIYLCFILKHPQKFLHSKEVRKAEEAEEKGLIIRLMYEGKVNSWWISCLILFGFLQFFM